VQPMCAVPGVPRLLASIVAGGLGGRQVMPDPLPASRPATG
jgi:hypothetical protein